MELVVVLRSDELEVAEDMLSLALVALVGGTRPLVTPTMVREHLRAASSQTMLFLFAATRLRISSSTLCPSRGP